MDEPLQDESRTTGFKDCTQTNKTLRNWMAIFPPSKMLEFSYCDHFQENGVTLM